MTERELQVFSDYRKSVYAPENAMYGLMAAVLDMDEISRRTEEERRGMARAIRAIESIRTIDGLMEKCGYVPDPSPDGFGYVSAPAEGAES